MLILASRHRHLPRRTAHGRGVRAWVWLLAALFLLATLAPAISRTLDHGRPVAERGWVEVCSARGMAWVPTNAASNNGDAPLQSSLLHHLDSCGYCVLATDRGTPPPSFDGLGLTTFAPPPVPLWAGYSLNPAPARTPQARGPPVSF